MHLTCRISIACFIIFGVYGKKIHGMNNGGNVLAPKIMLKQISSVIKEK